MTPVELLKKYELANNSHDIKQLRRLIHDDATYIFTDGVFKGLGEILNAIKHTFDLIQDETYKISDVSWVFESDKLAICTYKFQWQGKVNGRSESGGGVGTNIIKNDGTGWKMLHEHLSSPR